MVEETDFYSILSIAKERDYSFREWVKFLNSYPLTENVIKTLSGVPQGLKYHPEFCNLKHTYLVFKAVCKIGEHELIEAAFLHDIGKKLCTNVGNNRIYAYGHAAASADFVKQNKECVQYYDLTYDVVKKHMDFNDPSAAMLKEDQNLRNFIIY